MNGVRTQYPLDEPNGLLMGRGHGLWGHGLWWLLLVLLSVVGAEGISSVSSCPPVVFPRGEGAWWFGGFGDGGVGGVNNFFSFWAHGIPGVVTPVAVYAAGACGGASLVLIYAQVR